VLHGERPADVIMATKESRLSLLPRGRLDPVDAVDFEAGLRSTLPAALAAASGFDRIVIDTPSGVGVATRAGLAVADGVLAPVQAEPLALRSLHQLLRVVEHVRERENPRLALLGLLPTMADKRQGYSQEVLMELWGHVDGVLETVIPRVDVFGAASLAGVPVAFLGGALPPEARRFQLLADELETRIQSLQGGTADDVERAPRCGSRRSGSSARRRRRRRRRPRLRSPRQRRRRRPRRRPRRCPSPLRRRRLRRRRCRCLPGP
jgi:chromosome partitioning protein